MAKWVPLPVTGALSKSVCLKLNMPKLLHSGKVGAVLESSLAELLLHLSPQMEGSPRRALPVGPCR